MRFSSRFFRAGLVVAGLAVVPAGAQDSVCATGLWSSDAVCADPDLAGLNRVLARIMALARAAPAHPALTSVLETANEEWREGLEACQAEAEPRACLEAQHARRRAVARRLHRALAGPRLPAEPIKSCAKAADLEACLEAAYAAAETVYRLMAQAADVASAAVDIQVPAEPDAEAGRLDEDFRRYRASVCRLRGLASERHGAAGVLACQTSLAWRGIGDLAQVLGRAPHWSDDLAPLAPGLRACLARARQSEVDLSVIDVFANEAGERVARLMGGHGRFDCVAQGETVLSLAPVAPSDVREGEGQALFVPVAGSRPLADLLRRPPAPDCLDDRAVLEPQARLAGWIVVSNCLE